MTALKIDSFTGVAPRYSARLLPPSAAQNAVNVNLLSGELRGLHETQLLYDFNPLSPPHPIQRAFRLPSTLGAPIPISGSDNWIGFADSNVDFVRTPIFEDSFERYYWTGDSYVYSGVPQYNTRARINAGSPSFRLGLPNPVAAPTVVPAAGVTLTRAYIYTFVSAYGEEGPPSNPTTATGDTGTWVISGFDTVPPVPYNTEANITTVRIYRTVAGTTLTEYYHVADVALGTTTYNDTALDAIVALNYMLPSLTWTPPPATLEGLVAHPGGFMVGFSGRDLWMSEPYQPHAFPLQYVLTCQTEIAGIAIYNNSIIITTTSHPYIASGMSPLSVTLQKLDSIDPCVSRRSIATTLAGVFYASPQGIIRNDGSSSVLVTTQLFTRLEWQEQFSPTTVYAVSYGLQYIAFDTTSTGFIFTPPVPRYPITELDALGNKLNTPLTTLDRFSNVTAIQIDAYSGDVYIVQSNQVRLWDPPESSPLEYTWLSKQFDIPKPLNFGAFRIKFAANPYSISASELTDYTTFNNGRISSPLNPLNWAALNTARYTAVTNSVLPQIKNPAGGSPLYNIAALTTPQSAVTLQVYARDLSSNWNMVYANTVTTEKIYRLPAGFKSDGWQFEMIGNTNVYMLEVAETPTELRTV